MVDSRLKGEWLGSPRFEDLSDTAWRMFTLALMWSNNQATDGVLPVRSVARLHPEGQQDEAVGELIAAGLILHEGDDYVIPEWGTSMGQSTAAYVEDRREKNRQKQQGWRERQKRGDLGDPVVEQSHALRSESETGAVTGAVTGYVGQAQAKEQALGKDVEPFLFCSKHPRGTDGAPCVACRDARLLHEAWERSQRSKPTPTTPRRTDPATCEHKKHPVENYCLKCDQVLDV